jgi:phosphonate degradation associated HDIG domain protein
MNLIDQLAALYADRGLGSYFGEQVSMLEHGLQAAWFAGEEGAPPAQIVAALLHDIGHLVVEVPDDIADWHTDAHHEDIGAAWLSRHFGPEVTEPIALHVAAKRYLCAVDAEYRNRLSPASIITLGLQGGPMDAAEVAAFEARPFHREAVRLRHWDDQGKLGGFSAPGFDIYPPLIAGLLRS